MQTADGKDGCIFLSGSALVLGKVMPGTFLIGRCPGSCSLSSWMGTPSAKGNLSPLLPSFHQTADIITSLFALHCYCHASFGITYCFSYRFATKLGLHGKRLEESIRLLFSQSHGDHRRGNAKQHPGSKQQQCSCTAYTDVEACSIQICHRKSMVADLLYKHHLSLLPRSE